MRIKLHVAGVDELNSTQGARPPLPGARGHYTEGQPMDAGWSSPVAREAHNLEVAGSNPVPATFLNPSQT